jgi:hypothetical protein
MKRVLLTLATIVGIMAPNMSADPITQPEAGKKYTIQQKSSTYYLTLTGEDKVKVYPFADASLTDADTQVFTIESVAQDDGTFHYRLKAGDDRYVGSDSRWTAKAVTADDTSSEFTFPISTEDNEWVRLYNVNRNKYWASDNANVGSTVYTDKESTTKNGDWQLIEYTGELVWDNYDTIISDVEAALESATTGDEAGCWTQSDIDTLTAALATAKEAKNATTQNEISSATTALNDAYKAFTDARISIKELKETIASAEELLSAGVGSEVGNYTQDGADALAAAIEKAKGNLTSTDKEAVATAISDLEAAITESESARIQFAPKEGVFYSFTQTVSGMNLGMNDTPAAALQTPASSNLQRFMIESSDGSVSTFRIKYIDDNGDTQYLATKGNWDTTATADGTADVCQFDFVLQDLAESTYIIKRKGSTWQSLASDSTDDGALVYSDKWLGHPRGIWKITELSDPLFINAAAAATFDVKAVNGTIAINGLNGACSVKVYSLDGRMINAVETRNSYLAINAKAGIYVVAIKSNGVNYKAKVAVR